MGEINLESALDDLPHGREFRFVDRLVALEPGVSGEGTYLVRGDEVFLAGHFPGNPMMPGVVLAEAIAQLAGVVAQTDPEAATMSDMRLSALRNVKILGAAVPGDELVIHAKISGRMGNLVLADGEVLVRGETLAKAVVTLSGTLG
ncbi:MAG: 3-hydroxyacyl-[acyl-carrier-protein] dehydratase [Verrucomicrobiales bacterium]|jgi:3-hydroxyacyl-[acyl-carrier-protein] dehydratase